MFIKFYLLKFTLGCKNISGFMHMEKKKNSGDIVNGLQQIIFHLFNTTSSPET